jgi:hypothetical protein
MKIQGLSIGDGGLQRLGDKKTVKVMNEKPRKGDSVELSQPSRNGDVAETVNNAASIDFSARVERIKSLAESIANDAYNLPELLEMIAERIVESGSTDNAVLNKTSVQSENHVLRSDIISKANSQLAQDIYSQPNVIEVVAGRLIDTLVF